MAGGSLLWEKGNAREEHLWGGAAARNSQHKGVEFKAAGKDALGKSLWRDGKLFNNTHGLEVS